MSEAHHHDDNVTTTFGRTQGDYSPSAIADYCGRAERNGRDFKCNCPICGRHSLSVTHGHKFSILVKCWHCEACAINDGYSEQRAYLIERGLLEPTNRETSKFTAEQYRKWAAERRAEAVRDWSSPFLKPVTSECIAGDYLKARGLESFIGHPALRSLGYQLLARVWHVEHGVSAIQWTEPEWFFMGYDQPEKATGKATGRITRGVLKGGAVWLGRPTADAEFVVGEGLESVLSAMLLLDLKCGAACLGPNMKGLVLPSSARRVHIAADNDETGRGAAEYTSRLWRSQGLHVRMSVPDEDGWDFNDVLRRRK